MRQRPTPCRRKVSSRTLSPSLLRSSSWLHVPAEYIVLYLPAGEYEVLERLEIRRSRVVLRGAGRGRTTLYFPKSLTDVYGPNKQNEDTGGYVNSGVLRCLALRLL